MSSMVLKLQCVCGKTFSVPQEAAGKKGQCPHCGNSLRVPIPKDLEGIVKPDTAGGDEAAALPEAKLARRASNRFQWKWLVTGPCIMYGSLVLVAAVGLLLRPYVPMDTMIPAAYTRNLAYLYALTIGFFVGGTIVGWLSEGRTILEPALAAVVAVGLGTVAVMYLLPDYLTEIDVTAAVRSTLFDRVQMHAGIWAGVALFLSIFGARLGEDLQAAL